MMEDSCDNIKNQDPGRKHLRTPEMLDHLEELERMFEQVRVSNAAKKNEERLPKIMLSPREETVTRPLRDKGLYTLHTTSAKMFGF